MASQTRTYDKKKLLGQIYTPLFVVEKILCDTGFYKADFESKKILDPACGDGRFLVPIAKHIIETTPVQHLKKRLASITGWDIDPDAIALCRSNLDELLKDLPFKIKWNLLLKDALKELGTKRKFDLIVGNPPYIRIQHLPAEQRKHIRNTYTFCQSGSTDAYVAFFQLAANLLTKNGLCGFITPNSYITSETGRPLRAYFSNSKCLKQITNYGSVRIFGNTGTYAAITIFGVSANPGFIYEVGTQNADNLHRFIHFSELEHQNKWHLSVTQSEMSHGVKLGEICQISVGITTLADDLYLFKIHSEKDGIASVTNKKGDSYTIERSILKPIIKGSKLKTSEDTITEYILFPYKKDLDGKNKIIPEGDLESFFPLAYKYLSGEKQSLLMRDNGKPNKVAWYAFGRAQGLDTSFGKKVIFSPMNKFPNFILSENPDCTVYSGYFLKYDGDYNFLLNQLNSPRMADFINVAGRDFQGGYKGYNKKVVENFIITEPEIQN
ncbi:class I SAM-dependent DNA methyltransferase [Dyadobacter sp. CY312]|uniref:HsdM family class I SAM-dependent methyltransferase n=1 Tax=Dyadobacter sp. CY312 TaxID=2907303 RepID=UPI001F32DCCA|nr:N-6 DNA methylase [Dyadobacter sp. CY312]MCE7039413.1 N-6 DNA methylase [Dyadobacter sp. CY312]